MNTFKMSYYVSESGESKAVCFPNLLDFTESLVSFRFLPLNSQKERRFCTLHGAMA